MAGCAEPAPAPGCGGAASAEPPDGDGGGVGVVGGGTAGAAALPEPDGGGGGGDGEWGAAWWAYTIDVSRRVVPSDRTTNSHGGGETVMSRARPAVSMTPLPCARAWSQLATATNFFLSA
ncbi:MAG: hypothetical protein BJ554DRAFT_3057 [Olpidium bornovanus]|uniref:Uncharacterized protein n=1 Tax=Olpidium bornovanus TaxID=278681 RepID=A0A8H8DFY1_9FUNG|nr:MAG: hypothetical protein BJ554DRAFT_3057 [Olpidium bornovanus]